MKKLIAQRQFLLCDRIGIAENKRSSGLKIDIKESEKNFTIYKVISVGDQISDIYAEGDEIFVEDSSTNIVHYEGKKYYVIDDAFVVLKLVEA